MADERTPTPDMALTAADLEVDEQGRLRVKDREKEKKIKESLGEIDELAAENGDTNYIGCGGNAYQCGKTAGDEFESVVNTARALGPAARR